jgi:hypothetical protein
VYTGISIESYLFPLCIYPEAVLYGLSSEAELYGISIFSILKRTSILVSIMAAVIYLPTGSE